MAIRIMFWRKKSCPENSFTVNSKQFCQRVVYPTQENAKATLHSYFSTLDSLGTSRKSLHPGLLVTLYTMFTLQRHHIKFLPLVLAFFAGFQFRDEIADLGSVISPREVASFFSRCPNAAGRNAPLPVILISRGRSGSTSTWQIMS